MKTIAKIIGFFAFMILAIMQVREMHDSRTWPSVIGVINSGRIDRSKDTRPVKDHAVRYRYQVRLQYSYMVNGVSYSESRLEIRRTEYSMKSTAEYELARYPVGKQVTVYYNPKQPEKSVLVR